MKRRNSSGLEDLNLGASFDPGATMRFVSAIFVDGNVSLGWEFDEDASDESIPEV
jgi:hypothetical protein